MPTALITGITGQDGSYLADLLLDKGYAVHGLVRRSSSFNTARIDHIFDRLQLHYGDMTDGACLARLIDTIQPNEIYNLAAQSHVKVSFDCPEFSFDVAALGTLRLLEACRGKPIKIYQASSSEMFGSTPPPQSEESPLNPQSPYACGKLAAHHLAINYRNAYGMFVACGILFNHESPRRGETFVTRKIAKAAARIKAGLQETLVLGNVKAKRDWGYAPEYVDAMWRMLQANQAETYVIATGRMHTVEDWLHWCFDRVGLSVQRHVLIDRKYHRPLEVHGLQGDASYAKRRLGWTPTITGQNLANLMVDAEIELTQRK